MSKSAYYLDLVKKKHGISSDYGLAKFFNVHRNVISNYRTGCRAFNDEMVFKVADALEINPAVIIAAINAERAKTEEKKKFWRDSFKRISGGAAAVIMSMGIALGGLPSPNAGASVPSNVYYVKSRRRWPFAFISLILLVSALDARPALADNMTGADWQREAVYQVLHVVDWGQTLDIAARPDEYRELNPLIGTHPSRGDVNRYFAITALVHLGITRALPRRYRSAWQYVTIGVQAGNTWRNARIGLRLNF